MVPNPTLAGTDSADYPAVLRLPTWHPGDTLTSEVRVRTSPRSNNRTPRTKRRLQRKHSSPSTHTGRSKTTARENQHRQTNIPSLHETTHPPLRTVVEAGRLAGSRIETLAGESGAVLDLVGQVHDAGEGVREVQTEQAADEVGEGAEHGDGHGEDEGDYPVYGAETPPEEFALFGADGGEVEDCLADFEVDGFHADVEVEDWGWALVGDMDMGWAWVCFGGVVILTDGEPAGEEGEDVADDLEVLGVDGLVDVAVAVLAVVVVDLRKVRLSVTCAAGS